MRKYRLHRLKLQITQILFLVACCLLLVALPCPAQEPLSSSELILNAKDYDGKEIIYEGEVIGEVMHRSRGAWVNVNDGDNSIGVWMPRESAAVIEYQGSYKVKGDILRVRGIFNYSCPVHGGDLDIHAISLDKIKSGWQKKERIIPAKRKFLILLSVILCLVLILKLLLNR